MRRYLTGLFVAGSLVVGTAQANIILNGSFENTTTVSCSSNNSNASSDTAMSNVTAWGSAPEIDIYDAPCLGPNGPIDGAYKVHVANQPDGAVDAFSFDLSSPLISGTTYDLSFYAASQSIFSKSIGTIDIGAWSTANAFGTQVFSATSTLLDTCEFFSASIVAGVGANFLSVRKSNASHAWIALDAFTLDSAQLSVPEPTTLLLLGLAQRGWGLRQGGRINRRQGSRTGLRLSPGSCFCETANTAVR